jgi:multiple sugar transport system permease protein
VSGQSHDDAAASAAVAAPPLRRHAFAVPVGSSRSLARSKGRTAAALSTPALVVMFVTFVVPLGLTIYFSLTSYALNGTPKVVGFANFRSFLTSGAFWQSVSITAWFVLAMTVANVVVGLGVASLLAKSYLGVGLYRLVVYLPQTISYAIVAVIWVWLYSAGDGPIDRGLEALGLPSISWLADSSTALPSLIIASIWRDAGFYMLIFVAALQNVPASLVEAARIDGAGAWSVFRHVKLPTIRPQLMFATIVSAIGAIQMFTQAYVMTDGGPVNATESVVLKIYNDGFQSLQLGYASAEALVLLLATFVISIVFVWRFQTTIGQRAQL